MMRISRAFARLSTAGLCCLFAVLAAPPHATAQTAPAPAPAPAPDTPDEVGGWPKISLDTVVGLDYAGFTPRSGRGRDTGLSLRLDSTFLAEFNDTLSLDGLFQYKPRQPLSPTDPNHDLFINQGAGREEGGKMKELYVRYGDYRFGKFVQDFGRAYALLPGPYVADLVEEPEQGYEPADMIGVERIHVFGNETTGWRQLSVSAFMVDRTFLHESFPFNEGLVRYKDGGVGNTKLPENLMATYDVLEQPIGHWAHISYQASVIRWGRTYGAQAGEVWSTMGADISIPLHGSVADTLRGRYAQLHLYVEGARRDNFDGIAGQVRHYLSASAEYLNGPWVLDLTTSQRWTFHGPDGLQKDDLYTTTVGYTLPSATVAALSIASETVGERRGIYAGLRFTQTLTTCSRCLAKGRSY